ncbi:glucokinase [Roseateles amylovorans]|uniref:Glucokinase n=1 Tax=Roseateles amylovorans TaxID=2978473 RepID=A0ABY6AY14_9BURK|nr:glucokinase [Roseateles amylovorans]UXH78076.1 glucokinase [Roseateles amylovorans]
MSPSESTTRSRGSSARLLADVGGTHVRFASQCTAEGPLEHLARYACRDFDSLADAIFYHLHREGLARPHSCAIGIATAITGDHVRMTNHHWSFSTKALQSALGAERLLVLNDSTALALSLPALDAQALRQVGGGQAVAGAPMGLVSPGTGLGVSGLLPTLDGERWAAVGGEGGHVTLTSYEPEEQAVLDRLQRRFGHVSAERAVSGPGLENLYQALAEIRGLVLAPGEGRDAPAITTAALSGETFSSEVLRMFCGLLGDVAGNVALTLGARGGLYIGGGIVPRLGRWLDESPFRARFESKGRFTAFLRAIPTLVVQQADQAALLGAGRALDRSVGH